MSNLQPITQHPPRTSSLPVPAPAPNVVTIAISGASSSGKTTLALLLAAIFMDSSKERANRHLSLSDFLDLDRKPIVNETVKPIVIHEDAYFKNKSYCPNALFLNTAADVEFVRRTLSHDFVKQYVMREHNGQTSGQSSGDDGSTGDGSEYTPLWCIRGPDTDCYAALDVPGLLAAVQHVRATGSLSTASIRANQHTALMLPGLLLSAAQCEAILADYSDLIDELTQTVKQWMREQIHLRREAANGQEVARPALCFIEGFLLFPEPSSTPVSPDIGSSASAENMPHETPVLDENRESRSSRRNSSYAIHDARKTALQAANLKARGKLLDEFEIKLFLPTSKAAARKRRFLRSCYIDRPDGERYPGQMWKTEGYFESIAWANYEKEHRWLFEDGKIEGETVRVAKSENLTWEEMAGDPIRDSNVRVPESTDGYSDLAREAIQYRKDLNAESAAEHSDTGSESPYDANVQLVNTPIEHSDAGSEATQHTKARTPHIPDDNSDTSGEATIHFCIPSEEAKELGISIRPDIHSDVATTVRWALENILTALTNREWVVITEPEEVVNEDEESAVGPAVYEDEDSGVVVDDGDVSIVQVEKKRKWYHGCSCF